MMNRKRSALAFAMAMTLTTAACSKSSTAPHLQTQAAIRGQVQQTSPEPTASTAGAYGIAAATTAASAVTATTVTVDEVGSNGSLGAVAHGKVDADGSFVVTGVPAGLNDLVVDVQASGGARVGRAMVYGATSSGDTIAVAPIDAATTVRSLAWANLMSRGEADLTSPVEIALFVHARPGASASILANNEIQATANGAAAASDAMTRVFAGAGTSLSATARATLLAQAAVDFQNARFHGVASDSAHAALLQAALDAYGKAGVSPEALVVASAAAASTMDAQVDGSGAPRGELDAEAVRMNLEARARLAAKFQSGAEASVADSVLAVLASTEASMRGDSTAAEIRAAIAASHTAEDSATTRAMLDLLLPNATALVRAQLQPEVQAVLAAAHLSARFSSTTTASAAAHAVTTYQTGIHTAVQTLLTAAGRTNIDANALTSLCIAAEGGVYIRAT